MAHDFMIVKSYPGREIMDFMSFAGGSATVLGPRCGGKGGGAPLPFTLHTRPTRPDPTPHHEKGSTSTFFRRLGSGGSGRLFPPSMQFVIPGCRVEPPLRACGIMVHLTYAALHEREITFESLLTAASLGQHPTRPARMC